MPKPPVSVTVNVVAATINIVSAATIVSVSLAGIATYRNQAMSVACADAVKGSLLEAVDDIEKLVGK